MRRIFVAAVAGAVLAMPVVAQQTSPTDKSTPAAQAAAPSPAEFDKRMAQMHENMKTMQEQLSKIQQTQDPQERQRLLQEHWTTMHASMGMMGGMWGPGMMGCCGGVMHPTSSPGASGPMMHGQMTGGPMMGGPMMGGPTMGWSNTGSYYSKLTPEQMKQRQYMTDQYLAMQQMMMNQMMWHQYWMMGPQPQPPAPTK